MTQRVQQTPDERKYWYFLKTHPYYLYIANEKSGKPEWIVRLWASSPDEAMSTADDYLFSDGYNHYDVVLPRNLSKNLRVGKFTMSQSHKLMQGIIKQVYSNASRIYQWTVPEPEMTYLYKYLHGYILEQARAIAVDNWKKSKQRRK